MDMTSGYGTTLPLHRRFDEAKAMEHVSNRYLKMRHQISGQVAALQKDEIFLRECSSFYKRGYPDWIILSGIVNKMLNIRLQEFGLNVFEVTSDPEFVQELLTSLAGRVYPARFFYGEEFGQHVLLHLVDSLRTYGFTPRRSDFQPETVEKFLRERMRHFEFDLKHEQLFGDPPGEWPNNWEATRKD
jgi:hypothetical protein